MENWVHVSQNSGSGDGIISISVDSNPGQDERTTQVKVSTSTLNKILTIIQEGAIMQSTFMSGLGFVVLNNSSNGLLPDRYSLSSDGVTETFSFTGGYEVGVKIVGSILVKTEDLNSESYYASRVSGKNFKVEQKEIGEYTYIVASVEEDGGVAGIDFEHLDSNDMTYHTIVESTQR